MNLKDVVMKLVGQIEPIGKSEVDDIRFENLKTLCDLVNDLVKEIDNIHYYHKHSHEGSVKNAATYADKFLTNTLGIQE